MTVVQAKTKTSKMIESYLNSQSYQEEFRAVMCEMLDKFGEEIFNLSGIGEQLDINQAMKKMANASSVANGSIDSNANAGGTTAVTIASEFAKPHALIQSYYRLWKWLKKNRGLDIANEFVEAQLSGKIYVNDMHYISYPAPYSYYGKSVIVVKYRGQILYLNMEDLFNLFSEYVEILPDRETIDLTHVNIQVLDSGNKFVNLTRVLRHKSHCGLLKFETKNGFTTIVTEDHPVILEDGSEKYARDINIGDRLMKSDCKFDIFDSQDNSIDRTKYIIGFVVGDGYKCKGTKGHENYQLSIKQKDLENHKVYDFIQQECSFSANNIKEDGTGAQMVKFGDKCWTCKNANINYGAQNKVMPSDILNWNRNEILSFIAGLIDSDGCVNPKNGMIDIRIAAYSVVQQVAEILRSLGFKRVRTSLMDITQKSYQFKSNLDMYRVSFVVDENSLDLVSYSDKLSAKRDLVLRERGVDGRFETNEVLKIRSMEEEYVYDITTETGHFHCQGLIQHNCYNHSCLTIAQKGLIGLDTKNDTKPPKYLRSYFDIREAYLLVAGNSTAGATGIANLIVVSTIFLKKMIDSGFVDSHVHLNSEEDCWQYYKEELTSFIYRLNQACRGGSQSLFTNVSIFDKHFLENIIPNTFVMIDDNVYMTDFETVKRAQEVYIDIMLEEAKRVVHTFPVTTACFSTKLNEGTGKYDIQDKEFLDFICEKNEATGFINLYGGDTSILSSCCRLRSDTSNQFFNSFGGASDQIGSMGVVAINLPQLAFRFIKDEEGFETELADLVTLAQEVNYAKRCLLQSSIKKGHLPLYSNGYMDLGKQFSTVGFIGLYEACEIMGYDNTSDEGVKFGLHILDVINTINDEIAHKYKIPVNLEGIPGENTCVKLAVKDKVLGFNNQYKMYSNQFIPLSKRCNIFDRVKLSGAYDSQCSGGSIMHITIDSKVSKETMKDFVISTLGAGVKYFAFNYKINQCKDCSHIFVGEHEVCPECGSKELEKFTRVVGFLTKISQWSQTRQEEDRQGYTL